MSLVEYEMTEARRSLIEIAVFVAVAAGAYAVDAALGLPEIYAGLAAICLIMAGVWIMVRRRGQSWTELGLRRPRRLWTTPLWFAGLFAAFFALNIAAQAAVQAGVLAPPDVSKFAAVQGNFVFLVIGLIAIWVSAAFFEEMIFRGFLLTRLFDLFGGAGFGAAAAIVVQSVIFGLVHFYQGPAGIVLTGAAGFLFAIFYVLQGRNMWVQIVLHGVIDTLGLIQFYLYGVPA